MKHIIYIILFLISFQVVAQEFADKEYYLVDSLVLEELSEGDKELLEVSLKEYHSAKDDTSKINALHDICENMMADDWSNYQYFQYGLIQEAMKNKEKVSEKLIQQKAWAVNNLGIISYSKGYVNEALVYFEQGLQLEQKLKNIRGVSSSYNNMAALYLELGEIPKALKYFHNSLKIREKLSDYEGMAESYNNIGAVYQQQTDYKKALEYFNKSLILERTHGNKSGIATSYLSIGLSHSTNNDLNGALVFFQKALKLYEELGEKSGIAKSHSNLGSVFNKLGNYNEATSNFEKGKILYEELEHKQGVMLVLNNQAYMEMEVHKFTSAERYASKALSLAQELGFPDDINRSANILSEIYQAQGKGMKALKMYKLYVQMKDSINNETTQKATIRQQTQYEFEKAQIVKENEAKEQARLEVEATGRRDNIQYSLIFLGILVLFVGIMMLGFIKVSPTIAEGLIFFAFLILFEFILVFAEPYLEQYTNGEPMYNLFANAVIALLIFPLHDKLETVLKKRIVK